MLVHLTQWLITGGSLLLTIFAFAKSKTKNDSTAIIGLMGLCLAFSAFPDASFHTDNAVSRGLGRELVLSSISAFTILLPVFLLLYVRSVLWDGDGDLRRQDIRYFWPFPIDFILKLSAAILIAAIGPIQHSVLFQVSDPLVAIALLFIILSWGLFFTVTVLSLLQGLKLRSEFKATDVGRVGAIDRQIIHRSSIGLLGAALLFTLGFALDILDLALIQKTEFSALSDGELLAFAYILIDLAWIVLLAYLLLFSKNHQLKGREALMN